MTELKAVLTPTPFNAPLVWAANAALTDANTARFNITAKDPAALIDQTSSALSSASPFGSWLTWILCIGVLLFSGVGDLSDHLRDLSLDRTVPASGLSSATPMDLTSPSPPAPAPAAAASLPSMPSPGEVERGIAAFRAEEAAAALSDDDAGASSSSSAAAAPAPAAPAADDEEELSPMSLPHSSVSPGTYEAALEQSAFDAQAEVSAFEEDEVQEALELDAGVGLGRWWLRGWTNYVGFLAHVSRGPPFLQFVDRTEWIAEVFHEEDAKWRQHFEQRLDHLFKAGAEAEWVETREKLLAYMLQKDAEIYGAASGAGAAASSASSYAGSTSHRSMFSYFSSNAAASMDDDEDSQATNPAAMGSTREEFEARYSLAGHSLVQQPKAAAAAAASSSAPAAASSSSASAVGPKPGKVVMGVLPPWFQADKENKKIAKEGRDFIKAVDAKGNWKKNKFNHGLWSCNHGCKAAQSAQKNDVYIHLEKMHGIKRPPTGK